MQLLLPVLLSAHDLLELSKLYCMTEQLWLVTLHTEALYFFTANTTWMALEVRSYTSGIFLAVLSATGEILKTQHEEEASDIV